MQYYLKEIVYESTAIAINFFFYFRKIIYLEFSEVFDYLLQDVKCQGCFNMSVEPLSVLFVLEFIMPVRLLCDFDGVLISWVQNNCV